MSCDCHGPALPPRSVGYSTALAKAPCSACAQAAAQIASTIPEEQGGTMKVAGLGAALPATVTMQTSSMVLMIVGALAAGAVGAYLLYTPRHR